MDFYKYFHSKVKLILEELAKHHNIEIDFDKSMFTVEVPKVENYGNLSTNAAMVYCKIFKINPLDLANEISNKLLEIEDVKDVSVVKPGFINFNIKNEFWYNYLKLILDSGRDFGKENIGKGEKINVEYVSANPTGPLHIGHGRGAVVGDVLANLYSFLGYDVTKEYYINDAGGQINTLLNSFYYRYMQVLGKDIKKPVEGSFYPGEYLLDSAKALVEKDNDKWIDFSNLETQSFLREYVLEDMLNMIKKDLKGINVIHDIFVSESVVSSDQEYKRVIAKLTDIGLIYRGTLNPPKGKIVEDFEPREQLLFKSSDFGDDTDRPLEKSSGERTYFANDMVYHNNKVERDFPKMLIILGADHIGYVKRITSLVSAISHYKSKLDAICCQLVSVLNDGKVIKMSKRAGNFVTIADVLDSIGSDAFRFLMITRKSDVPIDIDIAKIKDQNVDNPVFYIQYSYARANSVLNNANFNPDNISKADFSLLSSDAEVYVIKNILELPKALKSSIATNDPHKIYLFLMDLAKSFHVLWNSGRENEKLKFIINDNELLTLSRLSLVYAFKNTVENVFSILGIKSITNM